MFENPFYNFPLERIMEALGCHRGAKDMYVSPFRDEKVASLHIDRAKNVWYDHGSGMGGTNVQLIMMAKHCSKEEAYRFIASLDPKLATPAVTEQSHPIIEIKTVRALNSGYLTRYLESRKIPAELAKLYCKEVVMYNREKDRNFTLIAFENNAGGYALKAPSGYKSSTKSGITTINVDGHRTVIPSSSTVAVFEGFIDYLSWHVLQSSTKLSGDIVVLNSVNNLAKAHDYLSLHDKIICFLDNDQAGHKTLQSIKSTHPDKEIIDMSSLYQNHKDLNDLLQHSRGFTSDLKLKL